MEASPTWSDFDRAFHLINVSLGRTGTTSIAGIFRRHRAGHEFMFKEAAEVLFDSRRGAAAPGSLRRFLVTRDALGLLQVDSASFNHFFLPHLLAMHPAAKFLLVARPPLSWLDSVLRLGMEISSHARGTGQPFPDWVEKIGKVSAPGLEPDIFRDRNVLHDALPGIVGPLLRHWGDVHRRVLLIAPGERLLVLETERLSQALDLLAEFAGVDVASLDADSAWLNRGSLAEPILTGASLREAERICEHECREVWERLRARLPSVHGC